MDTLQKGDRQAAGSDLTITDNGTGTWQNELLLPRLDYITANAPVNGQRTGGLLPIRFHAEKWWAELNERVSHAKQ